MDQRGIVLLFATNNGYGTVPEGEVPVEWSPDRLAEDGTPIDEDGEDMVYVGWRFADDEAQR